MTVTLVYLDRSTRTVTRAEALEICKDPTRAGKVLDALTDDAKLQDQLRRYMDEY